MNKVRPKKHLGQHFLTDEGIAEKIVSSLLVSTTSQVLEVGPGMGVLTKYLINPDIKLKVVEIDKESIEYLKRTLSMSVDNIIQKDFLKLDLTQLYSGPFSIIGNFPYNISSQIFFKVLENKEKVEMVVGMLQKEVAERLCAKHGNKTYGILSVLLQTYYHTEYLFTVNEDVFDPPPKVKSGVIRVTRNERKQLRCDEKLFKTVVKTGFLTRRKTLRNALKTLNLPSELTILPVFDKRAEQLSVEDFIALTILITSAKLT